MASKQIGNVHGLPVRSAVQHGGGASESQAFFDADLADIGAMRARLTAIDGATYTAERLNQMSTNDMVFAIRTADNPTTL